MSFFKLVRVAILFFALCFTFGQKLYAQCTVLPPVISLGSSKLPDRLCSPVTADVNYTITFLSPTTAGHTYEVFFIWGDGSPATTAGIAPGVATYNVTRNHAFPANSDCEYQVIIMMRVDGEFCTNTQQVQIISTWRTDEFNGGDVKLISPVSGTTIHEVCHGDPVDVIFEDQTDWNCNAAYPANYPPNSPVQYPNQQYRWQQIVYNTPIGGSKIPNVVVNGVPITGAGGVDLSADYQDPRGVHFLPAAVVINDPNRRNALQIQAPGGLGPGSPAIGDEFEVTIRYWNICNPYDDQNVPGPPADLVNGDFPPVERTALIRIIDAPVQPIIDDVEICFVDLPLTTPLSVTNIQPGATYNWYPTLLDAQNNTNVIQSGTTFSPTAAQAPVGVNHYFVTATFGTSCISPAEDVMLTRRAEITTPLQISGPVDVCTFTTYAYSLMDDPLPLSPGGATEYEWTISPVGWTINSGQGTKSISVTSNGSLAPRTISVVRRYVTPLASSAQCESNPSQLVVVVHANPIPAPISPTDICEGPPQIIDGNPPLISPPFTYTSHTWSGFPTASDIAILNPAEINTQTPSTVLSAAPGTYTLRYTVTNSIGCSGFAPMTINIITKPTDASAPAQQLLCSTLVSNPLGGNTPVIGTGLWTLVSKPTGSSASNAGFSSQVDGPNATFTGDVFGQYVLRWTITNGICSSFADELVDLGTNIVADAGTPNAFCGPSGSLKALVPAAGTIGKGTWSQVGGPLANNTNFTNANSNTSGISLIDPLATGTYTYRWTVTSGSCPIAPDDVTMTFNPPVVANDLNPHVCESTIASGISLGVDLTQYHDAITGIVGSTNRTVQWFISPPPPLPTPPPPAIIITSPGSFDISSGTLYTRVTNTIDPPFCSEDEQVTFVVDPLPTFAGLIGVNKAVCVGSDPTAFIELAPAFGGLGNYTYQWQQSSDNILFTNIAGETGTTFDPPAISATTYYKRLVSSGACLSIESNMVTLTINPLPTATVSAPKPKMCEDEFFILSFDFTGTAPFYFDYNDGTNFVNNRIGANNTPIPIFDFKNTTTYTLTRLVDFNGCIATLPPNPSTTVDAVKINTDFTFTPSSQCSGVPFSFGWNVDADVQYTWTWNDGKPDDVVAPNSLPAGAAAIPHTFISASTSSDINIPITLSAVNNVEGCGPKITTKTITIFPTIFINVFPDKNVICSGETVRFNNSTTGGSSHHWYYREKGTTNPIFDERNLLSGSTQDFVFTNTTAQNPIVYEMVYEVSNANNCLDVATYDITVYRSVTASFDEGAVPHVFVGGSSTVDFSNTSNPLDGTDFGYQWEFGLDANPLTSTSSAVLNPVQYSSIGSKNVTLTAINNDAKLIGGIATGCASVFTKVINIMLPPLIADFTYTPQIACFPADITITENKATGDTYEWKLFSTTSADPLIVSNEILPTFKVGNPGTYFIELKTTSSITAQSATKNNSATPITIFDLPFAAFEPRPLTVYVPDEKVILTNESTNANQFDWDFGDGETSTDAEPTHLYSLAGKYTITLVAGFNHGSLICYDTAQQEITAKEGGLTKIPNAFTPSTSGPNGGISGSGSFNDVFIPITKGVEEFQMQIYDRWGNLIFESKKSNVGWDGYDQNGVLLPAGVYVYKLTMRLSNNQRTTQVGDVTLIR